MRRQRHFGNELRCLKKGATVFAPYCKDCTHRDSEIACLSSVSRCSWLAVIAEHTLLFFLPESLTLFLVVLLVCFSCGKVFAVSPFLIVSTF